jgi:hypothetical protein
MASFQHEIELGPLDRPGIFDGRIVVEVTARRGMLNTVLCTLLNLLLVLIICVKGSMHLRRWLSVILSYRSNVHLLCRRGKSFRGLFWLIISFLLGFGNIPGRLDLLAVMLSSVISCCFTAMSRRPIFVLLM